MTGFIKNIAELAQATWNLFCMAPVTCILLAVVFFVMVFCTYCFIKDIVWTDKGGPIILR